MIRKANVNGHAWAICRDHARQAASVIMRCGLSRHLDTCSEITRPR